MSKDHCKGARTQVLYPKSNEYERRLARVPRRKGADSWFYRLAIPADRASLVSLKLG
jgi:hypothetical protein